MTLRKIYKKILFNQFKKFIENIPNDCLRKLDKETYIFDDQIKAAKEIIIKYYETGMRHTILGSQMQSGKTGCSNALINIILYIKQNHSKLIRSKKLNAILAIDSFLFISGMDSNGLQNQTIERFIQIKEYVEEPDFFDDKEELENKIYMYKNYTEWNKLGINKKNVMTSLISNEDKLFLLNYFEKNKTLINYSQDRINEIYDQLNEIAKYENWLNKKIKLDCYKNSDANKLLKEIEEKGSTIKNCLIYIDESQFGTNQQNVVPRLLEALDMDLRNTFRLIDKNCFIVSISATPFDEFKANIAFIGDNMNSKNMVIIPVGPNYVGVKKYKENNCLISCNSKVDFTENSNGEFPIIEKIKNAEDTRLNKDEFAWYIIRVPNGNDGVNIIKYNQYIKNNNFEIITLFNDSKNPINYDDFKLNANSRIEAGIKNKSKRPIIFLIKGAFRAGMTIEESFKDYCRMIYDDSKGIEASLQGLLGRMCGYRTNLEMYKNTIMYTNITHAEIYDNWIESNYSESKIPTIKISKRELTVVSAGQNTKFKLTLKEKILLRNYFAQGRVQNGNGGKGSLNKLCIDHIQKFLEKNGIIKTENKINNFKSNTLYNYTNLYQINTSVDFNYADNTKEQMLATSSFPWFMERPYTKVGDVIINVNLIDDMIYIHRGIVKSNISTPKVKKGKQHLITDPNHPQYLGPQNINLYNIVTEPNVD